MDDLAAGRVAAVRQFNRFYTRRIGLLTDAMYGSGFSLAEMRVLWELAHRPGVTASELEERLGMDPGYLSRILGSFRERGFARAAAGHDARVRHLELTGKGRKAFAAFDRRSGEDVHAAISTLTGAQQDRLVGAMRTVEALLEGGRESDAPFTLRAPKPGDFGWLIHRHGALYAEEYGWDATFEALVAEIVAKFVRGLQPKRERCWIAERNGEIVGCVFLVERSATIAQLRLLLVEPSARGLGVGSALVAQCLHFARKAGYRKVVLWTNDVLHCARRIYERAGFRLVKEEKHTSFGHRLVGQTWELKLVSETNFSVAHAGEIGL